MKYFHHLLFFLTSAMFFFACAKKPAKVVAYKYSLDFKSAVPEFNSNNAFEFIKKQLSFGPRNPNSDGHKKTKLFLVEELSLFAPIVEQQNFTYSISDEIKLNLTNIVAKFNPDAKDRIMLCAHWDTRPWADEDALAENRGKPIMGANDGASGVGVVLEIARLLANHPQKFGVDIVLFDGEDYGTHENMLNYCIGSKYFAAKKPNDYSPHFAILLDMVGGKDAQFPKEETSVKFASHVVESVWSAAAFIHAKKFVAKTGAAIYDDHVPLNSVGIKSINIIDHDLVGTKNSHKNYWHTSGDTLDNIDISTIDEVGRVVTKFIFSLKFFE